MGWWPAEGNANDIVGNNNGTLINGVSFAAGKVGQAFSFNNSGTQSVDIPRSSSLNLTNQVTIEFWMKADTNNSMQSFQGFVTSDYYDLSVTVGNPNLGVFGIDFGICDNGTWYQIANANGGGATVSAGVWHHIAGTYDGTKCQLYVDGQPWGNPMFHTGKISPMLTNDFVCIGSEDGRLSGSFPNRHFWGLIDEASIYNCALSSDEIAAIYRAGSYGKCPPTIPPVITIQPTSQTAIQGGSTTFTIAATGTQPLSCQWQFNGNNMAGQTNFSLLLPNVQGTNAGVYSASVFNSAGLTNSATATLTVLFLPTVSLSTPTNGQFFSSYPANVVLTATASDSDSSIISVAFYNGTSPLGSISAPPYTLTWSNVAAGDYILTAYAVDENGVESASAPVNIIVDVPPTISITNPANNSTIVAPTNLLISATASGGDETVYQVEFFAGQTLLGITGAPYNLTWSNVPPGEWSLTAVAIDNLGGTTISSPIMLTVNPSTNLMEGVNAYVWAGSHSNINYGGSAILNVQSSATTDTNRDAYFTFNLGGITNISSAKLSVYASLSATGAVSVAAYSVTNTGWGEYTITWSNKPARVTALTTNTLSGTNGAWYQFDVTGYVRTNSGVISLALHEPTNSAQLVSINSWRTAATRPRW